MAQPTHGALWLDNWILESAIVDVSSQRANYQAAYLLNPHRWDTWATINATAPAQVVFDLGEPRLPESDAAQQADAMFWDLPLYQPDPSGNVCRWYLGAPTSFNTKAPRRYWGLRILPAIFGSYGTIDPWFEIGVVWLGECLPIRPWAGTRIRAKDPSARGRSYGGAMWSDPLTPRRVADVTVGGLTPVAFAELEARIRDQGTRHALLDLHATAASGPVANGGCMYGTFPEDAVDGATDEPGDMDELTFGFEEVVV